METALFYLFLTSKTVTTNPDCPGIVDSYLDNTGSYLNFAFDKYNIFLDNKDSTDVYFNIADGNLDLVGNIFQKSYLDIFKGVH